MSNTPFVVAMSPEVIADEILAKYGPPKSPAMLHAMLAFAAQMGKVEGAAACNRTVSEVFDLAKRRA